MNFFFFIQLSIQYFITLVIATAKSKTIHKLFFFASGMSS